ncbi:MAG: hypothetical protein ED557_04730 [Balneola sp.]|nr:MAG: hypothetical protein ED557_04730 [Balneola sp.]
MLFIICAIPAYVSAQTTMGAREISLGQATSALKESNWAIFGNPALLSSSSSTVGFYGLRNYGFAEITDMAAFGSLPTSVGIGALGFHRYGDNLFSETRIKLGYKNEWELLHFGVTLNYNHISFGGVYGSGGAISMDVGLASQITEQLWIGAKATNLNRSSYEFSTDEEDLATDLSIGFSYNLEEQALLVVDVVKDVRFPVSYRGGLEVTIVEGFLGRAGITTEPLTYSFGFGYGKDFWEINVAVQQHYALGLSPGFDILINL